jgi:glycosyltransferase involved in cell wall biosynthesis
MEPRVKIAHITTVDLTLRYILFNQLKDLQSRGYDLTTISTYGENVGYLEENHIPHISIPISRRLTPIQDIRSLWLLYRVIKRERFDIVHTHTPKAGLLGQVAAKLAGVPVIVNTVHGFYFHEHMKPIRRSLYILLEKIAARCSSHIFTVNHEDRDTAIQLRISPSDKIEVLGTGGVGIDTQRFDRMNISESTIALYRQHMGLKHNDYVVGFVGRLVVEKGLVELFAAIEKIRDQIQSLRILIIGPSDEEKADALNAGRASEFNIDDICVFTGLRQDIPELMALMNVFILPSHREGFPVSPMEASSMSLPVIVTNVRGCREVIEHEITGLVVPLGDVDALADAIVRLAHDPAYSDSLGKNGRIRAEVEFDENLVFTKVGQEYSRLLKEKGIHLECMPIS